MINPKCHTTEWIDSLSRQYSYPDKNLIEKVVRAMSLLDMLARSSCPFIFKGGSCLMLLLKDSAHRLSIDTDSSSKVTCMSDRIEEISEDSVKTF